MRTLILLLISALAHAQSDVPEKYWIDDSNFDDYIRLMEQKLNIHQ